jgi:hypothetical protein
MRVKRGKQKKNIQMSKIEDCHHLLNLQGKIQLNKDQNRMREINHQTDLIPKRLMTIRQG